MFSFRVDLADPRDHLKKTGASGYSDRLERRRHRKANGLFRSALIGDDQICSQRVATARNALDRGVERFQIDRDKRSFHPLLLPGTVSVITDGKYITNRKSNSTLKRDGTLFGIDLFDFTRNGEVFPSDLLSVL